MLLLCRLLCGAAVSLKTKCRDLILAWSAPIFADADAETRKRRAREREHRWEQLLPVLHTARSWAVSSCQAGSLFALLSGADSGRVFACAAGCA
jgi:hypothetical protein